MSGPDLNPCRYCGGEAKIRYDALPFGDQPMQADTSMALIECSRSNCVGQKGYRSTALAIAAWNTRAPVETLAVKPLVWEQGFFTVQKATAQPGWVYCIAKKESTGQWHWWRDGVMHIQSEPYGDADAAKAGAQADCEARCREMVRVIYG